MQVLDTIQNRVDPSHSSHTPVDNLLEVRDLCVRFCEGTGPGPELLKRINFAIAPGKIVGLLGESGCGKTTTALSIMGMLPSKAQLAGMIRFQGQELLNLDASQLRRIRGSKLSIIFQDSDVLHPVMRVGDQVMEVLRAHSSMNTAQMRSEIFSLFDLLGLEDHERIFRAYPHQLSGGQKRRIAIAQALVCKPRLVVADEPTAWLDVLTTFEILELIGKMRDCFGTAFLVIAHDPDVLAAIADEILVMYAGQVIENGPANEVLTQPSHPYTQALLRCSGNTVLAEGGSVRPLPCIPGCGPDLRHATRGCLFSSRCPDRMQVCESTEPGLVVISSRRSVRCCKYGEGV
jgi:oligopeptide/dipeptide ABC transporter ATP-binding protein